MLYPLYLQQGEQSCLERFNELAGLGSFNGLGGEG